MSAEKLREAASLMRERAEAIPSPDGDEITASWEAEYGPHPHMNGIERTEARHIASWHPTVALAVADLLEHHANLSGDRPTSPLCDAVARAYLGESS